MSYYTVLDMKSGYHQIEIDEEHKNRTAFTVGPMGLFEFNRLAFGLSNAPATYQRFMAECLGDLNHRICEIYLDDVIIFSKTFSEHLDRLEQVFQCCRDSGLKLSPKKCHMFRTKVKYVGHIVSSEGVSTDPDKISKASSWPEPINVDELRTFLGFTGYNRRYVRDYAKIARPLNDLLIGRHNKRKGKVKKKPEKVDPTWIWGELQREAFNKLKLSLTSPPILSYPDYSKPFLLHTDASSDGLGAILYQNFDGTERVIAYASRGLCKSERNYPAHKLEFLALKWAVTQKYHDYLYGSQFTVLTDNNPLTYVLSSAKLDATGHRWVAALANYTFNIKYRSGKLNADADALSRLPGIVEPSDDSEYRVISPEIFKVLCQAQQLSTKYVSTLCASIDYRLDVDDTNNVDLVNPREWRV